MPPLAPRLLSQESAREAAAVGFSRHFLASEILDSYWVAETFGRGLYAAFVEVLVDGSERHRRWFLDAVWSASLQADKPTEYDDRVLLEALVVELLRLGTRLISLSDDDSILLLQEQMLGPLEKYELVVGETVCTGKRHHFDYEPPEVFERRNSQFRIFDPDRFEGHFEGRIQTVLDLTAEIRSGSEPPRSLRLPYGFGEDERVLWSNFLDRVIDPMLGPPELGQIDICLERCGRLVVEMPGARRTYIKVDDHSN